MNKMKKISIITIILYMLFITNSFAATATIDVNSARLREEANTTSNILTNIYKGEKVEILEKNGEWYKVKYGNNTGYLKNTLLKEDLSSSETTNDNKENDNVDNITEGNENVPTDDTKIVTNSTTKIRYQPSMMSNVIIQVESGKELVKEVEIGNWIQVSDGSTIGWIIKNKVTTTTAQNNPENPDNDSSVDNSENNVKNETNTVKENNISNNTVNENKVKENTNTIGNQTKKEENTTTEPTNQSQVTSVNKKGKVNVETAKVRKAADKTAKIVGFLDYNDEITITAEEGEWYKFTEKDTAGYVHKTLITLIGEETVSSRGTNEERESYSETQNQESNSNSAVENEPVNNVESSNGQQVADLAKKYLGYKYVVGGKNPETGFDCSGFTRYIFLQFGYSLGTTAAGQNNLGKEVSRSDLKPGDLILFYDEGKTKIGHTGIYISNGDFVHSANPQRGVVIDNLNTNSYYDERYIVAKRVVE